MDVGYVGTHGDNLIGNVDLNQRNLATQVLPFAAQFPYLKFINHVENYARSNYNSLQSTLTKRLSHGFYFHRRLHIRSWPRQRFPESFRRATAEQLQSGAEYGNSDFDIRHRATFTASYDIPAKKGFGQLLEGWKLNTIVTLAGSQPWNVIDSSDNFSGSVENTDRWDFFGNPSDFKSTSSRFPTALARAPGGCSITSGVSGMQRLLDYPPSPSRCGAQVCGSGSRPEYAPVPLAATYPATADRSWFLTRLGTYGTMGRNIFRDTGFKNVDFSVFKTFTFKERFDAQFRVEFFNFLQSPHHHQSVRLSEWLQDRQRPLERRRVRLRVHHARHRGRQSDRRFGRRRDDTTRVEDNVLKSIRSVRGHFALAPAANIDETSLWPDESSPDRSW